MAAKRRRPSAPSTMIEPCLYLVTDSTQPILRDRDLIDVVSEALKGGVTVVQYRDKTSETADLIRTSRRLHEVCKRRKVPLLINDRVDVALAVGCEGVHVGQDDMDYPTARRILGPEAIIGVTVSSVEEAAAANQDFASDSTNGLRYLGIGTVFATATKEDVKHIIGPEGVREILELCTSGGVTQYDFAVAIGGINASNVQRVLFQSRSPTHMLDGVAVVSSIMAADDPKAAASRLKTLLIQVPPTMSPLEYLNRDLDEMIAQVPAIVKAVASNAPLCHNMTNMVVQNFAANVATAIGASPIMSNYGDEAADLASHPGGSLVVNMGTVTPDGLLNYEKAIEAYNEADRPILLDPVGGGATTARRDAVKRLMRAGYFAVIKGNESEITAVLGEGVPTKQQKGVDSGASSTSAREKAQLVRKLAMREKNVVLMTGETDYLCDDNGRRVSVQNGHNYLARITGSGCTLGTTVAAFLAVYDDDKFLATLAGVLMYEIAAERAAARTDDVRGPGTFVPALLDELDLIRQASSEGRNEWIEAAKVQWVR